MFNYVSENKDLIAKPILGALGSLVATGLAIGIATIISHIAKKNGKANPVMQQEIVSENVEPKFKEIWQNIVNSKNNNVRLQPRNPLTNIIGSGIKSF